MSKNIFGENRYQKNVSKNKKKQSNNRQLMVKYNRALARIQSPGYLEVLSE